VASERHLRVFTHRDGRNSGRIGNRTFAISNARTSRSFYLPANAGALHTNFVAARPVEHANALSVDDKKTSTTFHRRLCDNIAVDSSRHRRPTCKIAPLGLLGSDHSGGGAVDRSSGVGVVARASSRTGLQGEKVMRKRKKRSRMHLLASPTVPALRDARSATQGQRQGFYL